jgi:hypothetical protein
VAGERRLGFAVVSDEHAETPQDEPVDGDRLPDDLDVGQALVGPYQFPDVTRRRIAATLYAVLGVGLGLGGATSGNAGLWTGAIALGVIAAYHLLCAWPLRVNQTDALAVASREVGFPVGHASAQLTWRGLRSRPLWRVLVYSADSPPSFRGVVELDAVDSQVLFSHHERNPEDWSQFGPTANA